MAKSLQNFRAALNSVVNGVDARLNSGHYVQVSKKRGHRSRRNSEYLKVFQLGNSYFTVNSAEAEKEVTDLGATEIAVPAKAFVILAKGSSVILDGNVLKIALSKGAAIQKIIEEGSTAVATTLPQSRPVQAQVTAHPPSSRPPPPSTPPRQSAPPVEVDDDVRRVIASVRDRARSSNVAARTTIPLWQDVLRTYRYDISDLEHVHDLLQNATNDQKAALSDFAQKKKATYDLKNMYELGIDGFVEKFYEVNSRFTLFVPKLEEVFGVQLQTWREIYYMPKEQSPSRTSAFAWTKIKLVCAMLMPNRDLFEKSKSPDERFTADVDLKELLGLIYSAFELKEIVEMRDKDLKLIEQEAKDKKMKEDELKKEKNALYASFLPHQLFKLLGFDQNYWNDLMADLGGGVDGKEKFVHRSVFPALSAFEFPIAAQAIDPVSKQPFGPYLFQYPPAWTKLQILAPDAEQGDLDQAASGLAGAWFNGPLCWRVRQFLESKNIIMNIDQFPFKKPGDI